MNDNDLCDICSNPYIGMPVLVERELTRFVILSYALPQAHLHGGRRPWHLYRLRRRALSLGRELHHTHAHHGQVRRHQRFPVVPVTEFIRTSPSGLAADGLHLSIDDHMPSTRNFHYEEQPVWIHIESTIRKLSHFATLLPILPAPDYKCAV